jgi:hypothetical protein
MLLVVLLVIGRAPGGGAGAAVIQPAGVGLPA